MVTQYPHHLFIHRTSQTKRDEFGHWIGGESTIRYAGVCREESSGKGARVQVADGHYMQYSSVIMLPNGTNAQEDIIKEGDTIRVTNDRHGEQVRIETVVLKFDEGQLHDRLWV